MKLHRDERGRRSARRLIGGLLLAIALLAPIVVAAGSPGANGEVTVQELGLHASAPTAGGPQATPQEVIAAQREFQDSWVEAHGRAEHLRAVIAAQREYQDSRVEAHRRAEHLRAVIAAQREYQTSRVVAYLRAELERLRSPTPLGLYVPGRCEPPPDVIAAAT